RYTVKSELKTVRAEVNPNRELTSARVRRLTFGWNFAITSSDTTSAQATETSRLMASKVSRTARIAFLMRLSFLDAEVSLSILQRAPRFGVFLLSSARTSPIIHRLPVKSSALAILHTFSHSRPDACDASSRRSRGWSADPAAAA